MQQFISKNLKNSLIYLLLIFKKLSDDDLGRFSRQMQDYVKYMPTYDGNTMFYYKLKNRLVVTFNDGTATNIEILKSYSGNNGNCTGQEAS